MAGRKIGGGKTRLAECLSLYQVLLGPLHNRETDRQVESTEEHQ